VQLLSCSPRDSLAQVATPADYVTPLKTVNLGFAQMQVVVIESASKSGGGGTRADAAAMGGE
jgi:hypothetical protein